ncbi:DNA-binding transcriptional dual regulator CRP, putative [Bodo saltans]|uniref:DNA-binding transcriptional dual regulator CRP, putative n=1 Tax=Bodo saltans TaxID=75058 RepID=A0A0S4IIC6_BODSA|nr:DNA-binding transcriptional dual regulator CRP, putative [Bodo saltans]|eukprot:CUE71444.1 DNA-binding transcriptional dual regulator CRP, putative [Bodo saltans]
MTAPASRSSSFVGGNDAPSGKTNNAESSQLFSGVVLSSPSKQQPAGSLMSNVNQTFNKMYLSQRNPTRSVNNSNSPQTNQLTTTVANASIVGQQFWAGVGATTRHRASVSSSGLGTTTPSSQHRPSLLEGGPLGGDEFDEFDRLPAAVGGVDATSRSNFLDDDDEEEDDGNSSNVVESVGSNGASSNHRRGPRGSVQQHSADTRFSSNSNEVVDLFSRGLHFFGADGPTGEGNDDENDEDDDGDEFVTRTIGEKALSQYSLVSATSGLLSHQSLTPSTKQHPHGAAHHPTTMHPSSNTSPGRASSVAPKRSVTSATAGNRKQSSRHSEVGEMASMVSLHSNAHLTRKQSTANNSAAAETRRKQVKERRAQLNQSFRKEKEQNLEGSRMRIEIAAERKIVMSSQMTTQRHWAWAALCHMSFFATRLASAARAAAARQKRNNFLLPMVHICARRWLRYTRMKRLQHSVNKPLVSEIRLDRTLGLFSENHLEYLLAHLKLRYYFDNETIIFMGCEDDECFVLANGAVDVIVGHTVVSRLSNPGVVFGSVGMISGEPRTASIIARAPTLVWVCTRAKFEAFGMTDNRVQDALAIIADLRQNNLRAVYKRYITPNYLGSFAPMKDLSCSTLDALLLQAAPMVTKAGVRILLPYSVTNLVTHKFFFVLRGTIKISFANVLHANGTPIIAVAPPNSSAKAPSSSTNAITIREYVQRLVQFPLRGARVTFAEEAAKDSIHPALVPLDTAAVVSSISEGSAVVTLKGPLIMNMHSLIVNETLPFTVETVGGCDMLYLTRQQLMALDPVEIDNVRRRCVDHHREFILPLPPRGLRLAVCRGPLSAGAHSFLKGLDVKKTHVKPPEQDSAVLSAGDVLHFDPEHGMVAYIILRGQLQGVAAPANGEPYLWPDLHLVYFGSVNAKATAITQADVIRVRRRDIVDWLVTQLVTKDMELYVAAMTQAFEASLHRKPHFSFECIDSTNDSPSGGEGGAKNTFRDSRKRSMLALHRTNNFTVSSDTVEQTRASQNRSINAALVYQEATSGRQALLRKRTSNRLHKLKSQQQLDEEEDEEGEVVQSEDGDAERAPVDRQASSVAGSKNTNSFHRNASTLSGERQHAFTTFGLTMTASAATLNRGDGTPRSASPFSSMDGYHDYTALGDDEDDVDDDDDDDDDDDGFARPDQQKQQVPPNDSSASPSPFLRDKRGTMFMAATSPPVAGGQPSAVVSPHVSMHSPIHFMGTEQSPQPPATVMIAVNPRPPCYNGGSQSGQAPPQVDLRSLEEFELMSDLVTPIANPQQDAFGASSTTSKGVYPPHNNRRGGGLGASMNTLTSIPLLPNSSYIHSNSSTQLGSSVLGVSGCGQIVVNRRQPHAPTASVGGQGGRGGGMSEFGERSVFGSTTIRSPQHTTDQTSSAFSRASPLNSNDRDTSTSEHPFARSFTNNNSFSPRSPQTHPPPQTSPRLAFSQHQPHSPGSPHKSSTVLSTSAMHPRSQPARMSLSLHAASASGLPLSVREHNASPPVTPPSRPIASGGGGRKGGRQHSPQPPSPLATQIRRPTLRPSANSSAVGAPKSPMRLNTAPSVSTTSKSPLRPTTTGSAFPAVAQSLNSPQSSSSTAGGMKQQQQQQRQQSSGSGTSTQSTNLGALLSSIRSSTATESGVSPRRDHINAPSSASATIDKWFGGASGSEKRRDDDSGHDPSNKERFLPTQHPKPKNDTVAERRRLLLRGNRK